MFGRGVLSRKVENKLSVPVPARGGRGALGTRRRGRPRRLRALADDRSLTWQENVVVSWTGMRGVVTLAAASGIPLTTIDGAPFPERATIQAIAFAVSVGTLLLQGLTLPLLIRWLRSSFEHDYVADAAETAKAEQIVHVAADEVLEQFAENPPQGLDAATLTNIRADDRTAFAGRRRDARPRVAHAARRGFLGALPRSARRAADGAYYRT